MYIVIVSLIFSFFLDFIKYTKKKRKENNNNNNNNKNTWLLDFNLKNGDV